MIDLDKKNDEYYCTRAQYEARKTAGTLVVGAVYHITDENLPRTSTAGKVLMSTSTEGKTEWGDYVIPAAPTADGTYVLKCTISGGVVTYSWVLES